MMKLANKAILVLAISSFSLTAYAYDDPQTDYDSLYAVESQTSSDSQDAIDVAALEPVSRTSTVDYVDPQTDYDSLYVTDYSVE